MSIEKETASAARPVLRLAMYGWATGAMFFFYAWILRVAPSVMIDELMRDFAVGAAAVEQRVVGAVQPPLPRRDPRNDTQYKYHHDHRQ